MVHLSNVSMISRYNYQKKIIIPRVDRKIFIANLLPIPFSILEVDNDNLFAKRRYSVFVRFFVDL